MRTIRTTLTVFFEEPFWAALYEREYDDYYEVCKIVFGAEPKDYEINDYFRKNWFSLKFSASAGTKFAETLCRNPKRMQREAKKQIQQSGIGTKAQQALKLQQEQNKTEGRKISRERSEEEKQRQFELRQSKRKEKHRGH